MRRIGLGPAGIRSAFAVAITAYAVVGLFAITGHAGQARQVTAGGSYSIAQATRGKTLYSDQCVACHGEMLEGVVGPPLTGDDFVADFGGKSVKELADKIHATMPQQAPGTLSDAQSMDLTAYLLQANKYPAGADMTAATAAQFTLPAGKAAPAAAAAAVNTGGMPTVTASANLAQFMRAVTFPNANIIFNTQVKDPGATKPVNPVPFDYVLWGATVYYGWQAVDQAALALIETTPMFMVPGRRCENGRPVPIQNADYQKFTQELIALARELYKTSQSRNQDAVSGMSEKLNDACANCHKVYRDVGTAEGGGLGTDRCKQ